MRAEEILRELKTSWLGRKLYVLEEADSTNLRAWQLAREGAAAGTVIIAEAQTAGHGRFGRAWESPAGKNLYLSVILRPQLPADQIPRLTLVAAAALKEALTPFLPEEPKIKWPNDLQWNGLKLAGILCESEGTGREADFVIVGIGVNINAAAGDFSPAVREIATSLKLATGAEQDRLLVTRLVLEHLETMVDRFIRGEWPKILEICRRASGLTGRRVILQQDGATIAGIAQSIDDDGALVVERENGPPLAVNSGEVTLCS